jgi:hypothetical protein
VGDNKSGPHRTNDSMVSYIQGFTTPIRSEEVIAWQAAANRSP